MDIAIAIRIGSPASSLDLVKKTIESIEENIGKCSYRFIISIDPTVKQEIKEYLASKKKITPERFEIFPEKTVFWSEFINDAIKSANDCDYFIKSHDDIELLTPDFFEKIKEVFENSKEKIGWVSFDETGYLDGHWSPPTRPGYYKDFLYESAWDRQKMFQFHTLHENWWKVSILRRLPIILQQKINSLIFSKTEFKISLVKYPELKMTQKMIRSLDIPQKPVLSHAPWNSFILIKMSTLKDIGQCESWKTYNALMVDEDWGLRALKLKYRNIWIPYIKHLHKRPKEGGDRSQWQIKNDNQRVNELFEKKWGFAAKPTDEQLEKIKSSNQDNYIPWSIGRNSYDWDYLKTK